MAPQVVEFDRIAPCPLSVTSLCPCRSNFGRRPISAKLTTRTNFQRLSFNLELASNAAPGALRIRRDALVKHRRRVISAVAAEQPERIDDTEVTNEVICYEVYVPNWNWVFLC